MKLNCICRFVCMMLLFITEYSFGQKALLLSLITDSAKSERKFKVDGFLATSYLANSNWKGINHSSITFATSIDIEFNKKKNNASRIHEFNLDLSYIKYNDSILVKANDLINHISIWDLSDRTISKSISINFKTQTTDTWHESIVNHKKERKWKSGPMLPATLISGLGLNVNYFYNSYLNISIASLKFYSKPRTNTLIEKEKIIVVNNKILIYSEYGINIQSLTEKYFSVLKFENRISFFANKLDKKTIQLDMQNTITIKPMKFFKIRFENFLSYDYKISHKLQNKFEMLVGFSYEK
jgi:hypothetical protein